MNTFLGIQSGYADSDFVILPVPYENKVSWLGGTKNGPRAILDASMQLEFFSTYFKENINDKIKIHTENELEVDGLSYGQMIAKVSEKVSKYAMDGKKFALLGGEHSISIGAFESLLKNRKDISVLHLDAHADLKDSYLESKYSHGCVMKRLLDLNKNFVSAGIRDYSKEEHQLIKKEKLDIFGTDFDNASIVKKLNKKVYITLDLDVFDPAFVPAVSTPQPGGLDWKKVLNLIKMISQKKEIIGFDLVELCPIKDNKASELLAAKLLQNMVGYCFFSRFR